MSTGQAERAAPASAMDYRAEVARCLHEAAGRGIIPQRVALGRAVTDLASPAECAWLVDRLCRSDLGRRWAYVAALQPELGQCIAHLRQMWEREELVARGVTHLASLRQRTGQRGAVAD